jgi:hypothetical protein
MQLAIDLSLTAMTIIASFRPRGERFDDVDVMKVGRTDAAEDRRTLRRPDNDNP